jgi:hypothetical protein
VVSKSRRLSDTNLIGFDSLKVVVELEPAAATHRRRTTAETKVKRAIFFLLVYVQTPIMEDLKINKTG